MHPAVHMFHFCAGETKRLAMRYWKVLRRVYVQEPQRPMVTEVSMLPTLTIIHAKTQFSQIPSFSQILVIDQRNLETTNEHLIMQSNIDSVSNINVDTIYVVLLS